MSQHSTGLIARPPGQGSLAVRLCLAMVIAGSGLLVTRGTLADDSVPVYDRIEEDWEVKVGEPDPDTHAPQIINVISPTGSLSKHYAILELNHSTQPEYDEGGLQLQLWSDEAYVKNATHTNATLLANASETIRYTLAMSISNGSLKFRVQNGSSTSWGSFGGDDLQVSCIAELPSLAEYSPTVSVGKSRVAFAGHRVDKFTLKAIRYYRNDELIKTEESPRQVHPPTQQ